MLNSVILGWVTFIYLGASTLFLIGWIRGTDFVRRVATVLSGLGLFAQTVALCLRWVESYRLGIGHAPLSNFYESLIFFSWAIVALYLLLEKRMRPIHSGALVIPLAFLFMAYASLSPGMSSAIQPLIPALRSNWLISHVITCFLGYSAFAMTCSIGVIYLFQGNQKGEKGQRSDRIPGPKVLEEWMHQIAFFGFLVFTVGIMTGSVWAHKAWGSYWSWDPKETWSLITWIVYAIMLHRRYMGALQGRRMAIISIIGFIAVLITFFGVNYLAGLHSYLG